MMIGSCFSSCGAGQGGDTPADDARAMGHNAVVELLARAGAWADHNGLPRAPRSSLAPIPTPPSHPPANHPNSTRIAGPERSGSDKISPMGLPGVDTTPPTNSLSSTFDLCCGQR